MESEYFIKGPVGKGLDLSSLSKGNHVFFCGGTGVLPFLDTFAYFLRKAINEFEPENSMFADENFDDSNDELFISVYAFFTKKDESIGLEILESL